MGKLRLEFDLITGSFLYNLGGRNYYFNSGTCVRVPSTGTHRFFFEINQCAIAAIPGCECIPATLPVEQPIAGYKNSGVQPVVDITPMCTSSLTQYVYCPYYNS